MLLQIHRLLQVTLNEPFAELVAMAKWLIYGVNDRAKRKLDPIADNTGSPAQPVDLSTALRAASALPDALQQRNATCTPMLRRSKSCSTTCHGLDLTILKATIPSICWKVDLKKCIDASPMMVTIEARFAPGTFAESTKPEVLIRKSIWNPGLWSTLDLTAACLWLLIPERASLSGLKCWAEESSRPLAMWPLMHVCRSVRCLPATPVGLSLRNNESSV
jgi:hypothetical protein